MAALMTLSQLSSGNPVYESYYRQLDPVNSGKVSASDAAQFLKKSGLSGSTLGKIWDLADSERKGYLDKRGFFIALRLVASAQGGNDISLNNLNKTLAAPKFRDTSSPLMGISTAATDPHWAIRPDEKGIFEAIFESLSPVNGLLPGEKVRPVLINSKLPMDVLGKIWELSDVDKDGQLDKEEFTVVMHLVYRAIDKEPVPATLPPSLIPPSKRKKSAVTLPGAVAVLPTLFGLGAGSSPLKETLRSTPPLINSSPLINTTPLSTAPSINLSPKHSFKSSKPVADNWVVPATDRDRYDDIFKKMDTDNDGLVTGGEVIEIFMQSTLSQTMLAQIWGLADTKQTGKLNREQFSLAMYLIQQKVSKGVDPPSILTPDMIPPSERSSMSADSSGSAGSAELTGIKELDDLSQEIAQLQREKFILEHEIREKEEAIRQQNSEVQEMQNDLDRESSSLQDLDAQKQDAQERLEEMDQQRSRLEGMVNDMKQKCQEESQKISSLQSQIRSQESTLRSQEDEASRTKTDLSRLQDEEAQLEQSLLTGRVQLDSIIKSLKTTQDEIGQARSKLSLIQENQREVTKTIEQYNSAINEVNGGNLSNLSDTSDSFPERESGAVRRVDESFKSRLAMFNNNSIPGSTGSTGSSTKERQGDPFQSEDPFKSDIFKDPFGSDPFKQSDPFKGTSSEDFFKRTDKADLFASSEPFSRRPTPPAKPGAFNSGDPFSSSNLKSKDSDPFGSNSYGGKGGFADFSQMSKKPDPPGLPSKKNIPNRPAPPYGGLLSLSGSESLPATGSSAISNDSFVPTHSSQTTKDCAVGLADLGSFGNETQQLEWAKRESQREEDERLRRMRLQEQQDLELAIALSKADLPGS